MKTERIKELLAGGPYIDEEGYYQHGRLYDDGPMLAARVQLLAKALLSIAMNSDEDNEWDGVDRLHANKETALTALAEAGITEEKEGE